MQQDSELGTSDSLLGKKQEAEIYQNKEKRKDAADTKRRRTRCIIGGVVCGLLLLLVFLGAVFLFADVTQTLRNDVSEKLGIKLKGYQEPVKLESWSSLSQPSLPDTYLTANGSDNVTDVAAQAAAAYIIQAERAWDIAWEILHDDKGWRLQTGDDLKTGKIYTKNYDELGIVHKLEAYVECNPEIAMEMFILETKESRENATQWNPTMEKLERLEMPTSNIDVEYSVVIPPVKIISRRDFVAVRHWKTKDSVKMLAVQSTTHPSKPPQSNIVRAHQKLGAVLALPVEGNPQRSFLKWTMNPIFGGWIPESLEQATLPTGMMKGFEVIRTRAKYLQQRHNERTRASAA